MARLVALDTATRTGIATGVIGGKPTLSSINFGRLLDRDADIFCRVLRWAERLLADPPDVLVIEAMVPQFDKTLQAGIRACILGIAAKHPIKILEVGTRTWRKYAFSGATMKRAEAKAAALTLCQQLGWPATDDDAAEAGCIWAWASAQVAPQLAVRVEPLFLREKRNGPNARTKSC